VQQLNIFKNLIQKVMSVNIYLQAIISEDIYETNKDKIDFEVTSAATDSFDCLKKQLPNNGLDFTNAKIISVGLWGMLSDYFWTERLEYSEFPELEGKIGEYAWVNFYVNEPKSGESTPIKAGYMLNYAKGIDLVLKSDSKYKEYLKHFRKAKLEKFCNLARKYGWESKIFWSVT
jgi:hypothetical protein